MGLGKTAISLISNYNVEVEAPIISLTGGLTILFVFITAFTIFLLTTNRLKISVQKTLPYPKYYLSEAISYISGQTEKFPKNSLLSLVDSLIEAKLIKMKTALLVKLIISLSSIFPIPLKFKRLIIIKLFNWIRGEL
ncbi:MAG: hypothetical protein QXO15_08500 [Nitrososphaerota archaeon]